MSALLLLTALLFTLPSAHAQGETTASLAALVTPEIQQAIASSGLGRLAIQHRGMETTFKTYADVQVQVITGKRKFERLDPVATILSMTYRRDDWSRVEFLPVDNVRLARAWGINPRKQRRVSPEWVMNNETARQMLMSEEGATADAATAKALATFRSRLESFMHLQEQFRIVPPATGAEWLSPAELQQQPGDAQHPPFDLSAEPYASAITLDAALQDTLGARQHKLPDAVQRFTNAMSKSPTHTPGWKLSLDYRNSSFQPLRKASWLFMIAALLFGFEVGRSAKHSEDAHSSLGTRRGSWWSGYVVLILSTLTLLAGVAAMGILAGRMPLSNMFESLTFTIGAFAVAGILFETRLRQGWAGLLVALSAWAMLTFANNLPVHMRRREPLIAVLDSLWLNWHVTTLMVSYSLFLLGFIFSLVYLLKDYSGGWPRFLPEKDVFESLTYRAIQIGWPLLGIGIFLGAVWANTAWGIYWNWDPKETWSLITWLGYAGYLHLRINRGWSGRRSTYAAIVGFIMVLITYFGVSYLPWLAGGLHSYA